MEQLQERIRTLESKQKSPELQLAACYTTDRPEIQIGKQLDMKGDVVLPGRRIQKVRNLLDTGSSAEGIVSTSFAKKHSLQKIALKHSYGLRMADGKKSSDKATHAAKVVIDHSGHISEIWCIILDIINFDIILGEPWLIDHHALLDFHNHALVFAAEECRENCIKTGTVVTHYRNRQDEKEATHRKDSARKRFLKEHDVAEVSAAAFHKMASTNEEQVVVLQPEDFEQLQQDASEDPLLVTKVLYPDLATISPDDYVKFFEKLKREMPTEDQLKALIPQGHHQHVKVFDPKEANVLPSHQEYDHQIKLDPEAKIPSRKLIGCSREQAQVIKSYIDDLLGKGFIRRSSSPYAAPVLVVKKPEGGLRVCIDYRGLNAITKKDRNTPPLIKETLARLSRARIFTKLDIIAAFNTIRIKEGDEEKTAFLTRYGLFEYLVMPFGLCNAPGTFQSVINETLREYLDQFCSAYLDDVLIYSEDETEHEANVNKVLEKLGKAGMYVDIKKCAFNVKRVKYLGLIITTEGIEMDPAKVEAIQAWKKPKDLRDVQSFLGFANFYRRFIPAYSRIAAPLSALTKKESKTQLPWKPDSIEEQAFELLKVAFTTAPTLAHFDPDYETWLETDASDYVVAAILSQKGSDGIIRPVAYLSQKMTAPECNYEIYDKELLAIVRAFEEWKPELAGTENPVKVLTDHKNLEYFMSTKVLNRRQARWAEFLSEFNFKISYRPGKQGTKPDSLTRRTGDLPCDDSDERRRYQQQILLKPGNLEPGIRNAVDIAPMLIGTYTVEFAEAVALAYDVSEQEGLQVDSNEKEPSPHQSMEDLLLQLRKAYDNDDVLQRIIQAKKRKDRRIPIQLIREHRIRLDLSDCMLKEGLLYVDGRIYVPKDDKLIAQIIKDNHDNPVAGHGGKASTFERIARYWYWPGMTNTVTKFVNACHICQATKPSREGRHGLLKPLPIPDRYWNDISVDFITALPESHRYGRIYQHIMVVVDRLSKKKKFIALTNMNVENVVQAFLHYIWREEGYPRTIVSDRGTQFTSKFWTRLCERIGTKPKLSTAFHPETDGQTEIVNQSLKAYLRAYINWTQNNWVDWLPIAEFEANSDVNTSTKVAPFVATKGYLPRSGLEPEATQGKDRDEKAAEALLKKIENIRVEVRT